MYGLTLIQNCERFETRSHFKSRLNLIVRVNVVHYRAVLLLWYFYRYFLRKVASICSLGIRLLSRTVLLYCQAIIIRYDLLVF